jgi:hypothetical protein
MGMEWLTSFMAGTAFILVFYEMEKRKKLEKRLRELEKKKDDIEKETTLSNTSL